MGASLGCKSSHDHNMSNLARNIWTPSGETILTMLAQIGETELLKKLPEDGATINIPNIEGATPLHVVARANNLVAAELLLNMGATAHQKDKLGRTPLHLACRHNYLAMAKLLIEHGADVNGTKSEDQDILSVPVSFVALEHDSKECFKLLLEHSADPNIDNNTTFELKVSLLSKAVGLGKDWAVPMLVEHGVDLNKVDPSGRTAPYVALSMNHCKMVELFFTSGKIDPNVEWSVPNVSSPLCIAAKVGCLSCVKRVISAGGNVNFRANECLSPLHHALGIAKKDDTKLPFYASSYQRVHGEIAAYLIKKGADVAPIWIEGIWDKQSVDYKYPHKILIKAYSFLGFQTSRMQTFFRAVMLKCRDDLVRLVVQAGYTPSEEDVTLFHGRNAPQRTTGYYGPWNSKQTNSDDDDADDNSLLEYLNHCKQNPKSLLNLSVVTVRQNLQHNVLWGAERLQVPKIVKDMIKFEVDLTSTNAQRI